MGMNYTLFEAIRLASFNSVSVLTGTGYGTANFAAWGGFATTILLICMFIGGCAGSTTCGVKIFRLQVLASTIKVQISRLLSPHGVVIAYYNKRPVADSVMDAVMGFFYLYILCFVIYVFLGMTGLDFQTALSGAATAISNVGPGLGEMIGPNGHLVICQSLLNGPWGHASWQVRAIYRSCDVASRFPGAARARALHQFLNLIMLGDQSKPCRRTICLAIK